MILLTVRNQVAIKHARMEEEKHAMAQITELRPIDTKEVGIMFFSIHFLCCLAVITNFYEDAKNTRKNSQDILPILSQFQYHIRRIQFIVSDFYYCNYYWHGYNMSTALITRAHSRL